MFLLFIYKLKTEYEIEYGLMSSEIGMSDRDEGAELGRVDTCVSVYGGEGVCMSVWRDLTGVEIVKMMGQTLEGYVHVCD